MPEQSYSIVEEKILKALEAGPLTNSEIREIVFQRHRRVSEIIEATERLERLEKISLEEIHEDTYAWALYRKAKPAVSTPAESHTYTENGWNIDLKKTTIQTLDELIEHCKIDLAVWSVKKCTITKWEMAAIPRATGSKQEGWRRPSTAPIVVPMFSVRADLEKRPNIIAARAEISSLKEDAKRIIIAAPYINRIPLHQSGNMLETGTPDLHIGKLGWGQETGWEDYDSKTACEIGNQAIHELVSRASHYKYDQVNFVIGNDLFNADNKMQTTTRGTPQSGDSRYHKVFRMGRDMITGQINLLRTVASHVRVIVVPGNHDELTAWQLGDSLECLFSQAKDVSISNAPTSRKYEQWGNLMLMWCHGHEGKKSDYALVMAVEQPKMWAATTLREVHTGHLHGADLIEKNGVRIRTLSSLCSADDWHARMCYVGNQRSAEAYMWNKQYGHLGTAVYTVPQTTDALLAA